MSKITFFRQKRNDGGIRTGVDVGPDTVLSRFDAGRGEHDPALVWYVDVRAEGPDLPQKGEAARKWFAEHKTVVQTALRSLADELIVGVDFSDWPIKRVVPLGKGNRRKATLSIVVSAVRRLEATQLSRIIGDVAQNWDAYVQDLIAA